ncbi:MAG TPA: hypothetical protein VGC41_16905 [Kofleriaceae bacterium]
MKWLAVLCLVAGGVHAEPDADVPARAVALLPLDADAKLELYGQPVANEVSRALVAGGFEVVVVGPKMAVPAKARLIVDGTIKARGAQIDLVVRIRDAKTGGVIDTQKATAPSQTAMDHAAEELSGLVLPSVKTNLARLIEADEKDRAAREVKPIAPPIAKPATVQAVMLVNVITPPSGDPSTGQLRAALAKQLVGWAAKRHHEARVIDPKLGGKQLPKAVEAQHADLAVELDVVAYEVEQAKVPLATAKVRVRISDPHAIVFDRVIVTDTIPGEKAIDPATLIDRVAREVLTIADPSVRRRIPSWF